MKIDIKSIPINELRFTTAGDWFEDEDSLHITIVKLNNEKYEYIVLMHELTEYIICKFKGITSKESDDFDSLWEEELKKGLHKATEEAGFDKRCPYRFGHIWGVRMERLFCFLLKVNWKQYCDYFDNFFNNL